jgi:O-antigen ligase
MNRLEKTIRQNARLRKLFLTVNGEIVIAQEPNAPLIIGALLGILHFVVSSCLSRWALIGMTVSFFIWAVLEAIMGVNLFRKILGIGVMLFMVAGMVGIHFL